MENGQKHILIVEDDEDILMGIEGRLSFNNYKTSSSTTANKAIERLDAIKLTGKEHFDLILTDLETGVGKNGIDVLEKARKMKIPAILMSAKDTIISSDGKEVLLSEIAKDNNAIFIRKPINNLTLMGAIKELTSSSIEQTRC